MARIVLDQYRKLIDCRLVQIMDRDRDTDFLDQLVFLVLQKVDGTNLEVQFIGVPAARLYTGCDQRYILFYHTCCIRYNPVRKAGSRHYP